jgi:hypothetical protein
MKLGCTDTRLRDVSSEAERDHKAKISDLEREMNAQSEMLSESY